MKERTMLDKTLVVSMTNELEMLGFLKANGTQCRFVSMTTRTPVVKMKASNPFHIIKDGKVISEVGLWKVSRKIGVINANYNTSVRRRIAEKLGVRLSEVDYENGKVWYTHLMTNNNPPRPLPVVWHKEESKRNGYYLQYFPQKSEDVYCNAAMEPVAESVVKPYLYAESERPDFKPAVISVGLRNIRRLKASGVVAEMPDLNEIEDLFAD
jgi:uncharacterized protein YerC